MEPRKSEAHHVFETFMDAVKVYLDQTGSFTVTSNKGVIYLFILYFYDGNAILSDPLMSINKKKTFYMPTPDVMTNSRTENLIPKFIG